MINALIDNHQIKGILMKATSNTSIDMNSKAQTATAMIK
jgi:hypothetical protein